MCKPKYRLLAVISRKVLETVTWIVAGLNQAECYEEQGVWMQSKGHEPSVEAGWSRLLLGKVSFSKVWHICMHACMCVCINDKEKLGPDSEWQAGPRIGSFLQFPVWSS